MEEMLLVVAVILLIALLVVPFVALALAIGARKRIRVLEEEVARRKTELRYLYDRMETEARAEASRVRVSEALEVARGEAARAGAAREGIDVDVTQPSRPADPLGAARGAEFSASEASLAAESGRTLLPHEVARERERAAAGDPARARVQGSAPGIRAGDAARDRVQGSAPGFGAGDAALDRDSVSGAGGERGPAFGSNPSAAGERAGGSMPNFGAGEAASEHATPGDAARERSHGSAPGFGASDAARERAHGSAPGFAAGDTAQASSSPARAAAPSVPFEQRLATWFTRAGAGALLLGLLYFYKYAVDNEWIGPAGRVALGALAGLAILAFAELTRAKTRAGYIHALLGVGLACLYISAYASHAFYHLTDVATAFAASTIILLLGAALAWRHRAEAVLILVLLAGFANPVLLSTGEDRPFALFSYLLILTSVALFVGIKHRFRISLWLAVAGVSTLFIGWYERFFDTHDSRGQSWVGDVPAETLLGAYFELGARIVPLAFVAIFTAQWLVTAFAIRREGPPDKPSRAIKPLAICALLLSHAGASALLFDQPRILGTTMIALGVLAVLSMRALDAMRFLLIPMLAAFALLAALAGDAKSTDHLILLGLLGVWSAVYVAAFLKDLSDRSRELSRADAIRASIAVFAFGTLATILLVRDERFYTLALALTGVSIVNAILASRAKIPGLMLVTLLLTAIPMAASAGFLGEKSKQHVDTTFLALAVLWFAAYTGVILRDVLRKHEERFAALITLVIAALCYLAFGLLASKEDVPTMRALITGGTGVVCLMFAGIIHRARPELRTWISVLAAVALGLFAPALAFGLSGATITVLWAVLAAISMLILAEARHPVWMVVVVSLVAMTLIRVFAIDIEGIERSFREFEYSGGRSGALAVTAFFNARAYALASSGVAFLGGAFMLARAAKKPAGDGMLSPKILLGTAPVLATIAYALLTALAVIEVRTMLMELPPPPPMVLDSEEFALFWSTVEEARAAKHSLLAMTTTVILGMVAMILLGIGFAVKDPFHRWLGLILFLGTLGKLVLWDVWNLARIYQVVSLTVVGALLLASGFLYARLKALFRGETPAAAAILLVALCSAGHARAEGPPAVPVHKYSHRAVIEGVGSAGDHRAPLELDLYRASASASIFDDLRIADANDREVPYVIRRVEPITAPTQSSGRILDPGELGDGSYRALFEIREPIEHCEVELKLSHSGSFLRRTRIETGDKVKDMQVVSEGAVVYSISGAHIDAESFTIRYPRSIASWVRITLLPDADAGVTAIRGASFSCAPPEAIAPRDRVPLAIVATKQNAEAKTTEIELDAGSEGVPIERIHLRVKTPELVRRVQVLASSYQSAWPEVGSGYIFRVGREGPEGTSIAIHPTRKRWFKVVVHDRDDAPIELISAEGSLPSYELIFRSRAGGPHTLYVGDKEGQRTSYDLGEILARSPDKLDAQPVRIQAPVANPQFGKAKAAAELPATEKFRGTIGIVLAVALLALGAWAVRLLRAPKT